MGQPSCEMVSRQQGIALAIVLIILCVITLLTLNSMENAVLEQKMSATWYAKSVALQSAEGVLVAMQAQLNGQPLDFSSLTGTVQGDIISDVLDAKCQQHLFLIRATASYQRARIALLAAYQQAHQPPLPNCETVSQRLWWQQIDS